jgi:hypothetical protein
MSKLILVTILFLLSSCNVWTWFKGKSGSPSSSFYHTDDGSAVVGTAVTASYPSVKMVYAQGAGIEDLALNFTGTILSATSSPSLPTGLSLSSSGTISGTPTSTAALATYTLTLNGTFIVDIDLAVRSSYVVNSTGTTSDSVHGDGFCDDGSGNCTLKGAIEENNNGSNIKDIYLPSGTYAQSGFLTITKTYDINGASENGVIIDGAGGGYRAFMISPTSVQTNNFSNFTLQNYNSPGAGGAFLMQTPTVLTQTFSNLTLDDFVTSDEGAVRVGGSSSHTVTVNNCTFSNNSITGVSRGGVFSIYQGNLDINDSYFFNNQSSGAAEGGAVAATGGTVNIERSLFESNSGAKGGAIHVSTAGTLSINNSTFDSNTSNIGGALYFAAGTHTITSSSFVNNSVTVNNSGAAIFYSAGTTTIVGSIFNNNLDPTDSDTCLGGITDGGFNLEDGTTCSWSVSSGAGAQTMSLGTLSDNGGVTKTIPLNIGSPAIDLGVTGCSSVDQRNKSRVDGQCDAGAFEY